MTTRAIFTSYQPYALQYAKMLCDQHQWEALYCFTIKPVAADFKKAFPKAVLHDYFDAIKCIPPQEFSDMVYDPIDTAWLDEFAVHESVALNMMERNDPSQTFTYKERLELYHDHIRYWTTILRKLKPDHIVLEEEPHEPSDYVLTVVAKKLGIGNIMFLRLPFFRMFPVSDFREGSPLIKQKYQEKLAAAKPGDKVELSEPIEAYMEKIRSTYDIKKHLYNQAEGLKKLTHKESISEKLMKKLSHGIRFFNLAKYPKRINALLDLRNVSFHQDQKAAKGEFRKTQITNREYYRNLSNSRKHNEMLKTYYQQLTQEKIDTNVPYIVYALNFQPERTTSPIGDHFVNQFLAIDMLAKSLPAGWKLYVKEHPSQFIHFMWGSNYRSKAYYDAIASLPNVQLVPLIYDIYQLIDGSKAVATITGTMAWESVVREKPAIIFGHTWYKNCDGILYASNLSDVKDIMQKIQSGYKPDYDKIRLFAKVLEEHSYPAFVGGNQEYIYSGISHDDNAKAHLQAVLDFTKTN